MTDTLIAVATDEAVATTEPVAKPALPTFKTFDITVPVGHVMPSGDAIQSAFAMYVTAGVRWHPEWTEPRVCVSAHRQTYGGASMGWSGDKAAGFPLPEFAALLAPFHGKPLRDVPQELLDLIAASGLHYPAGPEPMEAFILPFQLRR